MALDFRFAQRERWGRDAAFAWNSSTFLCKATVQRYTLKDTGSLSVELKHLIWFNCGHFWESLGNSAANERVLVLSDPYRNVQYSLFHA